eukprot:6747993-Ditylum_brightwellii.AAC.1
MGFYVHLPQQVAENTLRYTNGNELGGTFSEDAHLSIMEGSGLGSFFDKVYQPRIWNGIVHYTLQQARNECTELSLDARSSGDVAAYGNMFDLRTASQSITMTGLDLHVDARYALTFVDYEVFTKRDTFRLHGQADMGAWFPSAVGTALVSSEGYLSVPTASFIPVSIPPGTIQGFYVTLSSPNMISRSTTKLANQIYDLNDDLELRVGVSVDSYPASSDSYFGPME